MDQFSIKKAVAIFDMPENCRLCPISIFNEHGEGSYRCPLTNEVSYSMNADCERGEQCPLKVMEIKIDI